MPWLQSMGRYTSYKQILGENNLPIIYIDIHRKKSLMNKSIFLYNIRVNSRQGFIRLGYHLSSMIPIYLPKNAKILVNVRGVFKEKCELLFKQYFKEAIFFSKDSNYG